MYVCCGKAAPVYQIHTIETPGALGKHHIGRRSLHNPVLGGRSLFDLTTTNIIFPPTPFSYNHRLKSLLPRIQHSI